MLTMIPPSRESVGADYSVIEAASHTGTVMFVVRARGNRSPSRYAWPLSVQRVVPRDIPCNGWPFGPGFDTASMVA